MSEKWKCYNFVTGEFETPPDDEEGPSQYWIEGWNAYMNNGSPVNPYLETSFEAIEWQDGYDEGKD